MIKIEIDGKTLEVTPGSMIIEAADSNNIPIPRFCYHKKLSIAANCRMCLVEVEKAPKPLPACATPMTEGMKIWTKSPKAIEAQKSVMEFLLINHPLDCPICDQGGECELQDISLEYGNDLSRFEENKRVIKDKNLGPLIATDMTRCILCTRCIRFGEEITGLRELGAIGRGSFTEVTTFVTKNMESECSGNVIDLCPVGALTNKPFRFRARSWELKSFPSIAPHDCIGSNIYLHARGPDVLRIVPRENELINEVWISDRDRYSIEAINHPNRLLNPLIKKNNEWFSVSWEEALEFTAKKLQNLAQEKNADNADNNDNNNVEHADNFDDSAIHNIGALISPNTTMEEQYLAQKLIRSLGSNNIDHRLKQIDFSADDIMPLFPNLGVGLDELENQDAVLLIGSNLPKEAPLAAVRLRKMAQKGGSLLILNPVDFAFSVVMPIAPAHKIIAHPNAMLNELLGITKAVFSKYKSDNSNKSDNSYNGSHNDNDATNNLHNDISNLVSNLQSTLTPQNKPLVTELLSDIKPTANQAAIADKLLTAEKKLILLGMLTISAKDYGKIKVVANLLTMLLQAKLGFLTYGANSASAWLTGCVPHRDGCVPQTKKVKSAGLNTKEMLTQKQLKAYVLLGVEPQFDCGYGALATKTLKNADFVVAISAFKTDALLDVATVLLPQATYAKSSGTYVNATGHLQSVVGAAKPKGAARPLWKILQALGALLGFYDFNFEASSEILAEINKTITNEKTLQYVKDKASKLINCPDLGLSLLNSKNNKNSKNTQNTKISNQDSLQEIFTRIAAVPLYATDILVRHALPLQQTQDAINSHFVRINSTMAEKLNISDEELINLLSVSSNVVSSQAASSHNSVGNSNANNMLAITVKVKIDDSLLDHTVIIPQGIQETARLNLLEQEFMLQKLSNN